MKGVYIYFISAFLHVYHNVQSLHTNFILCVKGQGIVSDSPFMLAASSSSWRQEDGQTLGNMHSTLDSQQNLFTNYFTPSHYRVWRFQHLLKVADVVHPECQERAIRYKGENSSRSLRARADLAVNVTSVKPRRRMARRARAQPELDCHRPGCRFRGRDVSGEHFISVVETRNGGAEKRGNKLHGILRPSRGEHYFQISKFNSL